MKRFTEDNINSFIRQRLSSFRKEKKLSVRESASLSGIPESSYSCLERGYYRISLHNLYRILHVLGVSIDQVWPSGHPLGETPVASRSVPDADTLNYFRFREFVTLPDAGQAALLLRKNQKIELVYSFNLSESEEERLRKLTFTGLPRGWKTYRKNSNEVETYLALKDAFVSDHLKRILSLYMDLWLATQLA